MAKEKIVAVIPARGGSKGIPRKNVKELNGRPFNCKCLVRRRLSLRCIHYEASECESVFHLYVLQIYFSALGISRA